MFKNFLAILVALALIVGPDIPKIFADAAGPDGQINWARFFASIVGAFIAAWLVKTKQPPTAIGEKTQARNHEGGFVRPGPLAAMLFAGALAWSGAIVLAVNLQGCATTNKFTNAVVECAEDVSTNNPTAAANIRTCLIGLTGGGYMQCLSSLPFAAELIICIVSDMSRGTAQAMNVGDVDPVTATINRNANEFLRTQNISRK